MRRPGFRPPWRRRRAGESEGAQRAGSASRPEPADELAYLLLEEARLRSFAIWNAAGGDDAAPVLRDVHRELGLAAYLASAELDPDRRQERHKRARRLAAEPVTDPVRALGHTTEAAAEILGHGSVAPELTDHLQQAAQHLASARRLIARLRSGARHAAHDHLGRSAR